jgi:hypothetical protein
MRPDGNDAVSWLQFGCYKLIASVTKRTYGLGNNAYKMRAYGIGVEGAMQQDSSCLNLFRD